MGFLAAIGGALIPALAAKPVAAGIIGGAAVAGSVSGVATSVASSVMSSDAANKQQAIAEQQHVMNKKIAYEKWAHILVDESKQISQLNRDVRARLSSQSAASTQSGGGNLRFGGMKAMSIRNARRNQDDIFYNTEQRRIGFGLQKGEVQEALIIGSRIDYMSKYIHEKGADGKLTERAKKVRREFNIGDVLNLPNVQGKTIKWTDSLKSPEDVAEDYLRYREELGWSPVHEKVVKAKAGVTDRSAYDLFKQYEQMGLLAEYQDDLTDDQIKSIRPSFTQDWRREYVGGAEREATKSSLLYRPGYEATGKKSPSTGTVLSRRSQPQTKTKNY